MCPSEVLPLENRQNKESLEEIRLVAKQLANIGKIEITQKGKVVKTDKWIGPIRLRLPQSAVPFEYKNIDFREFPERYCVARGEQGVLSVEPYKSELLPLWRFKTVLIAKKSSKSLLERFENYRIKGDFVGMDMARKFIQMGYTRARRYANHRSGRKYVGEGQNI